MSRLFLVAYNGQNKNKYNMKLPLKKSVWLSGRQFIWGD